MAIALSLVNEEALIVSATGEPAIVQADPGHDAGFWARDGYRPGLALRPRADDAEVAAQVYQAMFYAQAARQPGGGIGGVLLHDSSEVHLHALRELELGILEGYLVQSNMGGGSVNLLLAGDQCVLEIPDSIQGARGNVK